MPITTIAPSSTVGGHSVAIYGGAASPHAALADASDATYVKRNEYIYTPMLEVGGVVGALPGGEDLFAIRQIMRASKLTSGQPLSGWITLPNVLTGLSVKRGEAMVAVPIGGPKHDLQWPHVQWGRDLPHNVPPFGITMAMHDSESPGISASIPVYKCYCEILTLLRAAAPSITVADADGGGSPIEGTQTPAFTISVDAIVEEWQSLRSTDLPDSLIGRLQVLVLAEEVFDVPYFEPDWGITPAVQSAEVGGLSWGYIDGSTPSTEEVDLTLPEPLPASGTYRLYARAQRGAERTAYASTGWGEWGYVEFTMDVEPAAAPTIVATTDGQAVEIDVTPIAVAPHTDPLITLERSADGGASWEAVRGGADVSGTYGDATSFVDHEAPRGVALTYRARVQDHVGAGVFVSAWATDAADPIDTADWNLKSPSSPEKSILGLNVVGSPVRKRKDDVAFHYPKGRTRPVAVYGGSFGYSGTLEVVCEGDTEIDGLEALLALPEALLLQDGFGASMWIRISEPEHVLLGTLTAPVRRYQLPYVEIDRPEG